MRRHTQASCGECPRALNQWTSFKGKLVHCILSYISASIIIPFNVTRGLVFGTVIPTYFTILMRMHVYSCRNCSLLHIARQFISKTEVKNQLSIGTAKCKVLLVFVYYILVGIFILTTFTVERSIDKKVKADSSVPSM